MRQTFTIDFPLSHVITSNRRADTWRRQKTKNLMRELTRAAAKDLYPCGSATIFVGVTKRTKGAYDPVNLTDTVKGGIDMLVDMGVIDEDNHQHLQGPWLYHKGVDKTLDKTIRLTFTLTDYKPIQF